MSKFRVGQRVRVKFACTAEGQRFVGVAGIVTRVLTALDHETKELRDGYGLDVSPAYHNGQMWMAWSDDQLEPATDCYDKTEWSECIWRPEHLRVGA